MIATALVAHKAATNRITTDRVQRLAYDALEAMRIAETHLKALRAYCAEYDVSEFETHRYIESDIPWWTASLRLVISTLQEKCYGPPTLPDRVFKAMASIEDSGHIGFAGQENLPGTEAIVICLTIASHMLEESRQLCECDDLDEALLATSFVVDTIKGWLDGMLVGGDIDERATAIMGKPLSRY